MSSEVKQRLTTCCGGSHDCSGTCLFCGRLLRGSPGSIGYLISYTRVRMYHKERSRTLRACQGMLSLSTSGLTTGVFVKGCLCLGTRERGGRLRTSCGGVDTPAQVRCTHCHSNLDHIVDAKCKGTERCLRGIVDRFPSARTRGALREVGLVRGRIGEWLFASFSVYYCQTIHVNGSVNPSAARHIYIYPYLKPNVDKLCIEA